MKAPIDLQLKEEQNAQPQALLMRLNALIRRLVFCYRYLRADVNNIDVKINDGVSTGWFDDGTNFRVTVTNGIITAIDDSSGAGHS